MKDEEDELIAVVIADHFERQFDLLCLPSSLIPFAGYRLIDYTLESLSRTDVKVVFVLTSGSSNHLVAPYLKKHWSFLSLPYKINHVHIEAARSVGDIMRELDRRSLLKSDFLLLQAGVIFNADINLVVAEHKKRRVKDKNAVMTLVYGQADVNHPVRTRKSDVAIVREDLTCKLVFYQQLRPECTRFDIPVDTCDAQLSVHLNAIDCNLAVCSNQIPPLFSDNFDYQTRHDLIKEILVNEDILGSHVYVYFILNAYANFVSDYHTYLSINFDILRRNVYPLVPDLPGIRSLETDPTFRYSVYKRHVYCVAAGDPIENHKNRNALEQNSLVGRNCRFGSNVHIFDSLIGSGCEIGDNCEIRGAILWDNVKIGTSCKVEQSVLCNNVQLSNNCVISKRCVLGAKVILPNAVTLQSGTVILSCKPKEIDDEISVEPMTEKGLEHCFEPHGHLSNDMWPAWHKLELVAADQIETSDDDSDLEEIVPLDEPDKGGVASDLQSFETDDKKVFLKEVLETLNAGLEQQHSAPEHLSLELNGSKYSNNIALEDFDRLILQAILDIARNNATIDGDCKPKQYLALCQRYLDKFQPLYARYYKLPRSQKHALSAIERYALAHTDTFLVICAQVLHKMHDIELLEEDVIINWYRNGLSCDVDNKLKNALMSFITWLEEAEEESSDGD